MIGAIDKTNEISIRSVLLQACGVTRRAGEVLLLDDVSVELRGGDRIAVVGPSGSGKTLLLRCLAMLDPFEAGEIRWQGKTVQAGEIPRFRSQVIYLHQRPALVEGTVEDNLRQPFSLRVHHDKPFSRARIVNLLESLGRNESFLSKQQRDLSGGEAQLTALLRAMQLDPNILLMDEPTAAIDAAATEMVETLVANWIQEQPSQRANVWVTHDQRQARRVATSEMHIREGRLSGDANERIR